MNYPNCHLSWFNNLIVFHNNHLVKLNRDFGMVSKRIIVCQSVATRHTVVLTILSLLARHACM